MTPVAPTEPGERADAAPAPGRAPTGPAAVADEAARATALGVRRVRMLAWRDLEDPEAGGSERHAHEVAARWAAAGLEVTLRTSAAPGQAALVRRQGYAVERCGRRYSVFPRAALAGVARPGRADATVEIWNGMPFFSPVWARGPRLVFLHHVHAEMWEMVLSPARARLGTWVERRLAPPLYRGTRLVTLSASARREIVAMLGLDPARVEVVAPGIDPRFSPGGTRSPDPLVAAVGRLVPVKRFDVLVDALVRLRRDVPRLRAVIAGEGYERPALEAHLRRVGASDWIELPGYLDDDALLELYRRAWVVASTSQREGWGMTLTEAAACGTPAVVSRIAGHADAVEDGRSGLLVPLGSAAGAAPGTDAIAAFAGTLRSVLVDPARRAELGRRARERATTLTWDATAAATLRVLVEEAGGRRGPATR